MKKQTSKYIKVIGSCHCGHTTYEIDGNMTKKSYCACSACQKSTGSDKAAYITVDASSLRFTGREPATFKNEGGKDCDEYGFWRYCPDCGSRILWQPNEGDQRDVLAGTLSNISIFTDDLHEYFTK